MVIVVAWGESYFRNMEIDFQIGIIGSGLAGIAAALKLKKAGKDSYVIFEKSAEAGGIWRDNIYPGCRCDVVSHVYSFFDELNPNWESLYATQSEIYDYINHVIDKNEIREHIKFNTDIVEAIFIPEYGHWLLRDGFNQTIRVKVLIVALGKLIRPKIPFFKNADQFKGKIMHSANWDSSYQLNNKRVGVVGTGASAVQIIPSIIHMVKYLTVFQRSAPWITFRHNINYTAADHSKFKKYPFLLRLKRFLYYRKNELLGSAFVGPKWINRLFRYVFLKNMAKAVYDPGIIKKLTPDYNVGCKRVMRSDDYYPVLNRPNVDLEVDQIDSFTADGIKTIAGKEYKLDAVIMATGFEVADFNFKINIIGLKGQNLRNLWRANDAQCYKGMITSGFPNLAFVSGPNTASGFNSSLLLMEAQASYIVKYIDQIELAGKRSYLDLRPEVQNTYMDDLHQRFQDTVWLSGCQSYHQNSNGKNVYVFPGYFRQFKKLVKRFRKGEYLVFHN